MCTDKTYRTRQSMLVLVRLGYITVCEATLGVVSLCLGIYFPDEFWLVAVCSLGPLSMHYY